MQRGNLAGHDILDNFEIDTEIAVDQAIPGRSHLAPLDSGMRGLELFRQALDRLADDLQAAHDGSFKNLVGAKSFQIGTGRYIREISCFVKGMNKNLASARCLSARTESPRV